MKKIRIYTTNKCVFCEKAKKWMKSHNITFEEINVETNRAAQEELVEKSGQYGVPVIQVGKKMMLGWNEARFMNLMEE